MTQIKNDNGWAIAGVADVVAQAIDTIEIGCSLDPDHSDTVADMGDRITVIDRMPIDDRPDGDYAGSDSIIDILHRSWGDDLVNAAMYGSIDQAIDAARAAAYCELGIMPIDLSSTSMQFDLDMVEGYRRVDQLVWLYWRSSISGVIAEAMVAGMDHDLRGAIIDTGVTETDVQVAIFRHNLWMQGYGVWRVMVPDGIDPSDMADYASADVFVRV